MDQRSRQRFGLIIPDEASTEPKKPAGMAFHAMIGFTAVRAFEYWRMA